MRLEVFDIRGRRVATLLDQSLDRGEHEVTWNGADFTGRRAAAGVYFYRLTGQDGVLTRKMLIVR